MRVLKAEGSSYEVGYAHGTQIKGLTQQLEEVSHRVLQDSPDMTYSHALSVARELIAFIEENAPEAFMEFKGLVDGSEWDPEQALLFQMLPYVTKFNPSGCTALVVGGRATKDGKPILLKNKDYKYIFEPLQTVSIVHSSDSYDYISFGITGWVGCDQGVNSEGLVSVLTWCNTTCRGIGIQSHVLHKLLLRNAGSVEEAIDFLRGSSRTGMCNYVLVDSSGAAAVFENAHERFAVRRMQQNYLVCTNHFVDAKMKVCTPYVNAEVPPERLASTYSRYDRAVALLEENLSRIDLELLRRISQDHFGGKSYYTICCHGESLGTIATFIGIPGEKRAFVRTGLPCKGNRYGEFIL